MPEMNIRNLKANLLQVMEYRATTPLETQEVQDYNVILRLKSAGILPYFPNKVLAACACACARACAVVRMSGVD
jgi:hypothetical protein